MTPDVCFICNRPAEHPHVGHDYWSNSDAEAYFAREDARTSARIPSMSAVETLDPREAVIV